MIGSTTPIEPPYLDYTEPKWWSYLFFILPLLVFGCAVVAYAVWGLATGVDFAFAFGLGGMVLLCLSYAVWTDRPSKYLGLMSSLLLWSVIWSNFMIFLPLWPVQLLSIPFGVFALTQALRLGAHWGRQRYARLAQRERPMLESEWVWTGGKFARNYCPQLGLGVWVTIGMIAAMLAFHIVAFVYSDTVSLLSMAHLMLGPVVLIVLWRRHPVAYPLVFLFLIIMLPTALAVLAVPFLFYWAEGAKPNLIFRHRFERARLSE
jgi:hypothetical protein